MNMWTLPSSQRFIARIADKMTDGQFCVVMVPKTLDTQLLVEVFSSYVYREEIGVCDILDAIPELPFSRSLCQTEFNEGDNFPVDIDDLVNTPISGSFRVIRIPSNECEAAQTMAATLQELTASAKRRKDSGKALYWTLLVVTPAFFPLPESDAGLEILYWQGVWRKADVELVFDDSLRLSPPDNEALGWWIYALCLGLGMTDPLFCTDFFLETPLDMASIADFCSKHPVAKAASLETKNALISCDNSILSRPGAIRRQVFITGKDKGELWAKGLLDCDESGDLVLHPAALAQAKRIASLERMICLGQQQVILPLQHRVLKQLHKQIAEICGNDWHKKGIEDSWHSVVYDIGPLPSYIKKFLRSCPVSIQDAAEAWRDVRHTVAHNTFLSFEKLHKAMNTLKLL